MRPCTVQCSALCYAPCCLPGAQLLARGVSILALHTQGCGCQAIRKARIRRCVSEFGGMLAGRQGPEGGPSVRRRCAAAVGGFCGLHAGCGHRGPHPDPGLQLNAMSLCMGHGHWAPTELHKFAAKAPPHGRPTGDGPLEAHHQPPVCAWQLCKLLSFHWAMECHHRGQVRRRRLCATICD